MKCLPRGGAPRIPADFWVEHQEAYNVRGKGLSSGLLVILIANRQGAEVFMSRARMEDCNRQSIWTQLWWTIASLQLKTPARRPARHLSARHTPRFRLPKTFPSCRKQSASATLGERPNSVPEESPASANAMLERFPKVHVRTHDPHSFSYSDGSAKKAGGGQQTDI